LDTYIPYTGEAITAHYALTDTDDDASQINWYLVDADGTETLAAAGTAADNNSFTPDKTAVGKFVKVVIIPEYVSGAQGEAKSFITESALKEGSDSGESADTTRVGKTAIFLAGDSTVKDYSAGAINNTGLTRVEGSWGEYLDEFFNEKDVQVYDYAEGGRSSWSFIYDSKQLLSKIEEKIQPGDYLFIQFGHNDCSESYSDRYVPLGTPDANGIYPITAPTDETNTTDPAARGTFKYYLNMYIESAKAHGATPVLVTPVSRMYFDSEGNITAHHKTSADTTNTYCTAVEQLGQETGTPVIDMFTYTKNLYEQAYKDDSTAANGTSELAKRLFATGEKTHHSKMGGFILATQMAEFIKESNLAIADKVITPSSVDGLDNEDKNEFQVSRAGVLTAYDKDESGEYTVVDEYWSKLGNEMIEKLKSATPTVTSTLGDVNGDGKVTAEDAQLTLSFVRDPKSVEVTAEGIENMKVTSDGDITSYNAACIDKKANDSSYKFEVESAA
jgi:lysophospholipase L1-like esterase